MSTIKTKFIICSLPRTGTKSMVKMMQELGFGTNHAPGPTYDSFLTSRGDVEVMADTPMYQPSVIQSIVDRSDETKFIYVEKAASAWIDSILKVGLHNGWAANAKLVRAGTASPHNETDHNAMFEVLGVDEFIPDEAIEKFHEHKRTVEDIIPEGRLLIYDFSQGWEPLCNFVGKAIPDGEIPHLNKDTMFDPVN